MLQEVKKIDLEIASSRISLDEEGFGFENKVDGFHIATLSQEKLYGLLSKMMAEKPEDRPSAFHAKRDWLEILAGQELSE